MSKFLPVVLVALMVQILAPVAACWAASIAASDPLQVAGAICHDSAGAAQDGQQGVPTGDPRAHGGSCAICCIANAGTSLDSPTPVALPTPYRQVARVVWHDQAPSLLTARAGSNTRARAPPSLS
ncbi:DUF2946 family protein [Bradyrhizobium sp. NP1]|uniref:DUF2946 family protein n=1 Tax=Bradyrhizobium sp. NP1 TaxID=3049772 RepID=UPI003399F2BB